MKEDEYRNLDFRGILTHSALSRREFLKHLGGGIIILFSLGDLSVLQGQRRRREYPSDFNAYLRIGEDGRVTCFTGKIEQGQGVITSLAQMLADELDVTFESVDDHPFLWASSQSCGCRGQSCFNRVGSRISQDTKRSVENEGWNSI